MLQRPTDASHSHSLSLSLSDSLVTVSCVVVVSLSEESVTLCQSGTLTPTCGKSKA